MAVKLSGTGVLALAAVAVVALGAFVVWRKGDSIIEKVNPYDPNNIAYEGVNEFGSIITGNQDFSLGSFAFDALESVKDVFGMGIEPNITEPLVRDVDGVIKPQSETKEYIEKACSFLPGGVCP